jgi:hypothetical protein
MEEDFFVLSSFVTCGCWASQSNPAHNADWNRNFYSAKALHRRAAVAELSVLLVVCSSSKHQGLSVVS